MTYREDFREVQRETWWTLPRAFFMVTGFLVLMYGIGFLATGGDLAIYRFWAPKRANAERVVFQNTQSYVQGKTEYLGKLRYQYQTATGDEKAALRALILNEASTVDTGKLPDNLQAFIASLGGSQ